MPPVHNGTRSTFWTVALSHTVNDIYPAFYPTLVIALRHDVGLSDWQVAALYASNQVASGLPQAFAAWWSDRHNTRVTGPVGLTISAICACLIGFAGSFWSLWALLTLSMIGNGMFHPVSSAVAGQVGGRTLRHGRAMAMSIFFAAGQIGTMLGPIACARINAQGGLWRLVWLMPLGLVGAMVLQRVISHIPHREHAGHAPPPGLSERARRARWGVVWMLFIGNSLRYTVNTGMYFMFNVLAVRAMPDDPDAATVFNGKLLVAMTLGMGVLALLCARSLRPGRERGAILWLSVAGCIFTCLVAFAGRHGGALGAWPMYVCVACTSLGFSSVMPITISLAQRLLPWRTSLASSLTMGVAWATAAVAPILAELFLGASLSKAVALPEWRIDVAFALFGVLLLVAGALGLAMPRHVIESVSDGRGTSDRAETRVQS